MSPETAQKKKEKGAPSWLAPLLIVLAGLVVYANSFEGGYILDDLTAIQTNSTIRHLSPLHRVLFPGPDLIAEGNTVEGRPLLNLSFALNHAAGGLDVRGYHAVNLLVHLLAGLLLFGIVRRTLLLPKWSASGLCAVTVRRVDEVDGAGTARSDRTRACADHYATWLATMVAMLWVVHPLQTESVTYMAQRAESLAGMFYLLTMYLAIRGFTSSIPRWWRVAAVAACVLGMMTKEIMVTAPLMVLLYDVMYVAGSLREAWRTRRGFYLGLVMLGWGVLASLMVGTGGSNLGNVKALFIQLSGGEESPGAGHGTHWLDYARLQWWAVARYLRLSIWPSPLLFSYGGELARSNWEIVMAALWVLLLLAATVMAWRRRHWTGFAGVWFFLILAPTSSVIPLSGQTVAEHRMYLPLAGVVTLVVVGTWLGWRELMRYLSERGWAMSMRGKVLGPVAGMLAALLVLGSLTRARNFDYKNSRSIWQDTVSKSPANAVAHYNLGNSFLEENQPDMAMKHYRRALEINPEQPDVLNNLGNAFLQQGRTEEAKLHFQNALQLDPDHAGAHINLGNCLTQSRQTAEALIHFQRALELRPNHAEANNNLGNAYLQAGRMDEALKCFRKAIEVRPDSAVFHNSMGNALLQRGDAEQAVDQFRMALEIDPDGVDALYHRGNAHLKMGRMEEAMTDYRRVLELKPDHPDACYNLANSLFQTGRVEEAMVLYKTVLKIKPDYAAAHYNLGNACVIKGRLEEATGHYRKAFEIDPDYGEAHANLGSTLVQLGNVKEAVAHYEEAVKIDPTNFVAVNNLAWILATAAESSQRDGAKALQLAEDALQKAGGNQPSLLRVAAAALAETGRFAEADETAERAMSLATVQGNEALAEFIRQERQSYQAGKPIRENRSTRFDPGEKP